MVLALGCRFEQVRTNFGDCCSKILMINNLLRNGKDAEKKFHYESSHNLHPIGYGYITQYLELAPATPFAFGSSLLLSRDSAAMDDKSPSSFTFTPSSSGPRKLATIMSQPGRSPLLPNIINSSLFKFCIR